MFERLRKRWVVHGLVWRKLLTWSVSNIPIHLEPFVIATWSALFYLGWTAGRSSIAANLRVIFPDANAWKIRFRVYRVFQNFAWSLADSERFLEKRTIPDWEFVGFDHFSKMIRSPDGAIILTAHMGNYDLGSYLFSEKLKRPITIVRAPEADSDTGHYVDATLERATSPELRVGYNDNTQSLAVELISALGNGGIVAIQGDRITTGVNAMTTTLFGKTVTVPTGPFALAMASRALIYPLFVVRMRRRDYRIVTLEPYSCARTSRDRTADLQRAVDWWAARLEDAVKQYWFQWFTFSPFFQGDGS